MLDNRIVVDDPVLNGNRIEYKYSVEGDWKEAFKIDEPFYIEYSCDISGVPAGVLIIPLLANLLPMAWVYDAEITAPVCDEDFYNSIPEFRKGYMDMYPMMSFGGKLTVKELSKNIPTHQDGVAAFFSGGADAFNTLTQHAGEKPTLLTIWGADVTFDDTKGWDNVFKHLKHTSRKFGVDHVVIKSCFKRFLNDGVLTKKVKKSGDGWWHGFQHGLGIISHAAPVMYAMGKKRVYIASSFTAADKGKVTCASDPTIDNNIRFCGADVSHDGYEFNRQMKLHNIVEFSKKNKIKIPLRVCWISKGGSNCCNCEKCFRTMLGIYAEGEDPRKYGFRYSDLQLAKLAFSMRYGTDPLFGSLRYTPIQKAMRENIRKNDLPLSVRWFYNVDLCTVNKKHSWFILARKIYRKAKKVVRTLLVRKK